MKKNKWNLKNIKKFMALLEKEWGRKLECEIKICNGNFFSICHDDSILFSTLCDCDEVPDDIVRMKLIYEYLLMINEPALVRSIHCQGIGIAPVIFDALGERICSFVKINFTDFNTVYSHLEWIKSSDYAIELTNELEPEDILLKKDSSDKYTVKENRPDELLLINDNDNSELSLSKQEAVEDFFIIKEI